MNTTALKTFAPAVRRQLMEAVTRKLDFVLTAQTPDYLTTFAPQVATLRKLAQADRNGLIDRVAYTWFNRLTALRFMDARGWHPFRARVLTPVSAAETQPELLKLTRTGALPEELKSHTDPTRLNDLLDGRIPSPDAQGEVYRHLVLAACRFYHALLPNLFEKLDDETELLLPDDLLTEHSVVHGFRTEISDEDCGDGQRANVEILGWLYQFYISERKDQVMARKSAVPTEDIPAVTQLFTPHWIVRYLVENSLGRLWLLNRPGSRLREHMPYFIGEADEENYEVGSMKYEKGKEAAAISASAPSSFITHNSYLKVDSPKEIRLLDPAVGSGHMLTYAFDLLTLIYEEEGYAPSEIPALILRHNLHGLEICPRAAQLAELALVFKAREKSRRFFQPEHLVRPRIIELQNITFAEGELADYFKAIGINPSSFIPHTSSFPKLLHQFEEAKNFGSLIQPCLNEPEIQAARSQIGNRQSAIANSDLMVAATHLKVLRVLEQAEVLTQRYHVVVANPPYMGSGAMNAGLKSFVETELKSGKADTYSAFMLRNLSLAVRSGYIAMITIPNWMFLKTFEPLRDHLLQHSFISSLVHCGRGVWGSDFGSCAFVFQFTTASNSAGVYKRLFKKQGEVQSNEELEANFYDVGNFPEYRAQNSTFRKITGSPIAYWIKGLENFSQRKIGDLFVSGGRNKTHDNEKYLRFFWEVARNPTRWVVYANGGDFRKYYGNELNVVDWSDSARSFYDSNGGLCNKEYWGKEGITWSLITAAISSFRIKRSFAQYSSGAPTIFSKDFQCDLVALSFLNSVVSIYYLRALNPTVNTTVNDIFTLPFLPLSKDKCNAVKTRSADCMALAHADWDNFETSWDFRDQPLLRNYEVGIMNYEGEAKPADSDFIIHNSSFIIKGPTLEESWNNWKRYCDSAIQRMQELETENNRLFIAAYGLDGELQPEVPKEQITLARAEARRDMAAFLSYAVGVMFGRYSLLVPGLVLADAGGTLDDYWRIVRTKYELGSMNDEGKSAATADPDFIIHNSSFIPDQDGIIPVLDGEWFEDDIVARTRDFLRATFGEATLRENLRFLEDSLGKDLRKYFLNDFYKDHLQTYKKRPIYWLVQSPKKGFSVLLYLHRYTRDTMNLVLNRYLRDYQVKLRNRLTHLAEVQATAATAKAKTEARKEADKLTKTLHECEEWERQTVLPLAQARIELDLDDGVKVNYLKLGEALAPIPGLAAKGED